jgi:hypothetical protein
VLLAESRPVKRVPSTKPDDEPVFARRPFARIVASPTVRRLAVGRLAAGLLAGALALGLLAAGGSKALNSAVDWLHGRPEHLLPFAAITLDPPPPAWIASGARGLLEQVRSKSNRPETLRVQDLDLAALAADFQRDSPWVRGVLGIERAYPNRLAVRLEYRRPVAFVRTSGRSGPPIYLDREGVVLPGDDLDSEAAGPLIRLLLPTPEGASVTPRDGRHLTIDPPARSGETPTADPVRDAARLAGFFHDRRALPGLAGSPIVVEAIHGSEQGLWVQLAGTKLLFWGAAPGTESPGDPDVGRKWDLLQDWLSRNTKTFQALRGQRPFLRFGRDRVEVVDARDGT